MGQVGRQQMALWDVVAAADGLAELAETAGRFPVLYADPPWAYRADQRTAHARGTAAMHYQTMTVADLAALPVGLLAADPAALFLWATPPCLPEALGVLRSWGFTYRTIALSWTKLNRDGTPFVGLGHYTRGNVELCLLGTRGRVSLPRQDRGVSSVILAPRREHSRKPDEAYERIMRLYAGPYCELFARTRRPGWTAWGPEADRFAAHAATDGQEKEAAS